MGEEDIAKNRIIATSNLSFTIQEIDELIENVREKLPDEPLEVVDLVLSSDDDDDCRIITIESMSEEDEYESSFVSDDEEEDDEEYSPPESESSDYWD